MVYGLFLGYFEVYLHIWYRYLTSGIIALSLAKEGKIFFFFSFAEFFLGKKKRVVHFRFIYEALRAEFGKPIGYFNSPRKNTQLKTKPQPK
jgi:hypothetical protein